MKHEPEAPDEAQLNQSTHMKNEITSGHLSIFIKKKTRENFFQTAVYLLNLFML